MPSPSQALYRARQFFTALGPQVGEAEREEAATVLGDRLLPLFDSMSLRDQRHCLDVYHTLRIRGCGDSDVLRAALLHDAGKGRLAAAEVRLWHRVCYVVLAAAAPGLLERLALRGGLGALRHHPERGALLAAAMGAPNTVVDLIRRHEAPEAPDDRLRWLQASDDSC